MYESTRSVDSERLSLQSNQIRLRSDLAGPAQQKKKNAIIYRGSRLTRIRGMIAKTRKLVNE